MSVDSSLMFGYSTEVIPAQMDLSPFVEIIESSGINGTIISDIMAEAQAKRNFMQKTWNWFTGQGDPILYRKYYIDGVEQTEKINNKVNVDYIGRIADTKKGYLFGTDVSIVLDKTGYNSITTNIKQAFSKNEVFSKEYLADKKAVYDFAKSEYWQDKLVELGNYATISGYAGNLMWYDSGNNMHMRIVEPWNCLFITPDEIYDPQYALRIYEVINDYEDMTYDIFVEFYDSSTRTIFKSNGEATGYTVGSTQFEQVGEPELHGMCCVPLIGYANNRNLQGDCDKIMNKILSYERSMSNLDSELEQLRLAYMVLENIKIDKKEFEEMRQTGALVIKSSNVNTPARAYFLEKKLEVEAHEAHLNRLHNDIIRDAGTIDLNNPKYATSLSSVAIKMLTMPLENKSKTVETKFKAANRRMWQIVTDFWARTRQQNIDYLAIDETWKRNLPVNKLEEAQVVATLTGNLSEETVFAQSNFVDDPDIEKTRIAQEGGRDALFNDDAA